MIRKDQLEKFSYVIIQKVTVKSSETSHSWTQQATGKADVGAVPTPVQILQTFVDTPPNKEDELVEKLMRTIDWRHYTPALRRSEYGRILRYYAC